jgi:hypothetical protein
MYGGVATPLALLHHNEMNGRAKHPALQTRSSSREDSYSGVRNAIRLPPLREAPHRDHASNGCENEPLLPSAACKSNRNGKKLSQEENLPPPPLPPHKNSYQPVQRQTSQVSGTEKPKNLLETLPPGSCKLVASGIFSLNQINTKTVATPFHNTSLHTSVFKIYRAIENKKKSRKP